MLILNNNRKKPKYNCPGNTRMCPPKINKR